MRLSVLFLASGLLAASPGQDPVDQLIEDLGAPDAKTREQAGEELKKRGDEVVPRLKKAAANSDAECAIRAREILMDTRQGRPKEGIAPRVRLNVQNWVRGVEFQMLPDGAVSLTLPQINEETGKREFRTYRAASIDEFKKLYPQLSRSADIDQFLRPPALSAEERKWWNETWSWLGLDENADSSTGNAEHDEFLRSLDSWYAQHRRLFVQTLKEETRAEEERKQKGDDTPRLGILVGAVGPALQIHLNLPEEQGILVVAVLEDSLAQKAGLKRFDILLSFDGVELPSEEDLREVVERAFDKEEFPIELIRDGKRQTLKVTPRK